MHNLNFKHLYYFWSIHKEGGVKKASSMLHLSQSTVSDQLRLLEESFGQRLFERRSKRMILTRLGELVFEYADRIFELGDELLTTTKNISGASRQIVRIGIVSTLAKNMMYSLVKPLLKDPHLFTRFYDGEISHLSRELSNGRLDLIFTDQIIPIRSRLLKSTELFERHFYVVCSPIHAEDIRSGVLKLSDIPLINYTKETELHLQVEEYLLTHQINSTILAEMDDIRLILQAIEEGLCWGILPKRAIAERIELSKVVALEEVKSICSSVYAFYAVNGIEECLEEIRLSLQ